MLPITPQSQAPTIGQDDVIKPLQTNRCWSCLTGAWDAFVGLLARIRNCFCCCFNRSSASTAPPDLKDVQEDVEGDILVSSVVDLFFSKVDEMDESVQAAAFKEQGLKLFSCLSLAHKYWMLKKLIFEYEGLPLSDYFPAFLKEINDKPIEGDVSVQPPLAQDEIRVFIIRAFTTNRGQTVKNAKLIVDWLNGKDKNVDASDAVDAAFRSRNLRLLMTCKATASKTSEEGAFVLKIVKAKLNGEDFDAVLTTEFSKFRLEQKVTILQRVNGICERVLSV